MHDLFIGIFVCLTLSSTIYADPVGHEWQPPQPGDSRSPCPLLNALANHGYLPRNGRDIDNDTIREALRAGPNFDPDAFDIATAETLTTSTTGNSSTFHLEDSVKHNVIEHDGSLSRKDLFFGDNLHLDLAIWNQTLAFFTEETVTLEHAARARAARMQDSIDTNPEFTQPDNFAATFNETAFYMAFLGDRETGDAPRDWVKILFEEERLPFAEGYVRTEDPITLQDIADLKAKIQAVPVC